MITTFKQKNLLLIVKCPKFPELVLDALFAMYERKNMPRLHNIFYIKLVGFCDAINIKCVKGVFRYLGNVKVRHNIKIIMF